MTAPDIFGRVKHMTIGEGLRLLAIIAATWASFWAFGGDYITARADEALVEALRRKGMAPESIRSMQDQLRSLGVDVDALRASSTHTNEELDLVQKRLEAMDANQRQTYDLLKTLIPLMKADLEQ